MSQVHSFCGRDATTRGWPATQPHTPEGLADWRQSEGAWAQMATGKVGLFVAHNAATPTPALWVLQPSITKNEMMKIENAPLLE